MSVCPHIGARFSTCDDLLAAIRSASFPREGSDKPICAEYTSRKTAGGKRFTVRCKIGIKKPGRKKVGERSREEEPRCLFRIVASRETVSATPRSYAFVVTEYDPHTDSAHEHDYASAAGDAFEAGTDPLKAFGPRRNAAGRFLPSTSKASPATRQQPPPSPSSPAFVPDSPVIIDSKLVLSSGFAIPLLPFGRDPGESGGGGGRTRLKKRPLGNCEHRDDPMWRMWEQCLRGGDVKKAAKRPRLRGTGGEDALRAWGWVSNLNEHSEPEDEEMSARGEQDKETDVMAETSGANAAPLVHKSQNATTQAPARGETNSHRPDEIQPEHQHLLAFWTRPTVINVEPVPVQVPWSKIMPIPITPFTPPPAAAVTAVQNELPLSPTPTESPSMSSFALESRHETPEMSFSPVSPTLYRPTAPIGRSSAGQPSEHSQHDTSALDNFAPADSKHRQEQDLEREQMALEALLGLQQLTFQLPAELAQSEPAPTSPHTEPRPAAELLGGAAPASIEKHLDTLSARKPPSVSSTRAPRKLSRWERPESAEHAPERSEHKSESAADDAAVDEAKMPSSEAPQSEEAPAASPPEPVPAALAFVPRAHKKPLTGRRVPSTPLRTTSSGANTGGPSMAFSSSHKAMMAVAQASKIKREADLREELRSASVAPLNVGGEMDGEKVAEAKAQKAREQAEALKHSLWKLGGEHEGDKIDRLYSAVALRDKLLQLERSASAFRTPEALSKPNAEVYISLLAGDKRPARHRLPSLPTFPHRPPASSPLSRRSGSGSSIVSRFDSNLQPDKRLLLALEYLYGRAVGPDECAYLAKTEPAMWELVKVAAAVAEVNEWIRRISRGRQSRDQGESTRSWRMGEGAGGDLRGAADSFRRQNERH